MNNPDIYRYERELGRVVKGFRRRRRVLEAFRNSLSLFLEDVDVPTYDDLEAAFGPPRNMAQDLIESVPDLPKLLSLKQKIGIFAGVCLIVIVACTSIFFWMNMPEREVILSDGMDYAGGIVFSEYTSFTDAEFDQEDFSWVQKKNYKGYLLLFENTNNIETTIAVKYSNHQPPHVIVIPAGGQQILQVNDARPTKHTISFDTSNGSMSGSVQVLMRLPA